MAYAVKYRAYYVTETGQTRQIDIEQDGYTGEILPISAMSEPELDWNGSDKKTAGIIGLEAKFTFLSTTDFNVDTLFDINPRKYKAKVKEDTTVLFVGWVQGDLAKDVYSYVNDTRTFEVTATDGLGDLVDIDIKGDSGIYTSRESVNAFLRYALNKTGLELNIITAVDYYDSYMSTDANSINQVTVDPRLWIEEEKTISTKEVLESFCQLFYCRLFQRYGKWHFVCIDNQIDATIPAYEYTAAGQQVFTTTTFSHRKELDSNPAPTTTQAQLNAKIVSVDNKLSLSRQRPLKRLEVAYDFGPAKNEINGNFFGGSTDGWTFNDGIVYETFSTGDGIGSYGLQITGATKMNILGIDAVPYHFYVTNHLTTTTRYPYDDKWASVFMTVKKYEKIKLSFEYKAPELRSIKICVAFVDKGVFTEANVYDDLSVVGRDGLGSDGKWYAKENIRGGKVIRHLLIPNIGKNAAGEEIIKSDWESYEISSTDGVPNDGWVVLYFYRGGNMSSENNNATLQIRNIDMSREEYGDVLNNLTMVLDNPNLEYGNAKESISIKYGEPPHSLNYSYLAKLNGQRTTELWDRTGISPFSPLQAIMGAMYMRQYSKYVTVLEGAIRAADVCMGDTLTLTGYAGKVFIITRLRSKTKSSLHEVTLVELIADDFEPTYYTKSSAGLSRFYGSLRLFLLGGGGIKFPSTPLKPARQGVEDLAGGTATQTGVSLDLIEAEFFNVPEDSTEWERVGATDSETGLYRLPTVAVNEHGVVIDKDDNTLETVWFKRRGEMLPLADILTLYPTNSLSSLPLAAQNGVSMWWTSAIETHPNAPAGLTGYAKVWIETLDKHCKVTVKSASGESYNFTQDVGATPIVWSGWKYKPHATTLAEVGKLFKADASQTLGQTNIWDNSDGTFSVGQAIKFTSAIFSVAGRLAAYDPLFEDDLVTLRYLQYAVSSLLSKSEFSLYYNQILDLLADKSNKNHGHNISEINNLSAELDAKINKSVLSGGAAYYVLGRDANGNAVMIDNKRCALNGQYLPDAIEGVFYSQTLAAELFVWPNGALKDIVLLSDKAWVRNGISFDYVTGLTIAGTPTDDENPHIAVKMKWRFAEGADWNEQEFTIFLGVEPAGTTITTPTAPSSLSATALGTNTIQLAWVDNSGNETGFRIYRGTSSGSYVLIATVGANTITYLDTGLAENTRYYYMVQAYNTAGFDNSNEADALTETSVGQTPVDEVVAGSSRIRKFGTVVTPPVDPPITPPSQQRPNIKFGFQPAQYVQADWVVWQNRNTGQRRTFPAMDQNNNPNAERPDSNWDVVEVTNVETWIKRTADAGCNLMELWFRTPLLQTSEFNYHFNILGHLMEVAGSYGVYLSVGIRNDIGNGGIAGRGGQDQSATWRYLLEDCAKCQQFNDETGTGTKTVYPDQLCPNLFRERVYLNSIKFYTAYANYWSNHPYKQWAPSIHPIYSNTGESHVSINEDRYMDASQTTMTMFANYLLNVAPTKTGLFTDFLANETDEGNATARAFLRGYSGYEAKAIWQWFLQDLYFGSNNNPPYQPTYGKLYQRLGDVVRAKGLKWQIDHGSFLDFSIPRQNMYALDSRFLSNVDVVKHNPEGSRIGYPEVAALRATGKQTCIEWTPGALWDFGDSIPNAISTITTACADSFDAGVDEIVLSFVVTGDYYNSIAIPIINNLKAMGYWSLPKQTFTPPNLIDVDLYQQSLVGGWYHNDSDGSAEYNEPIHKMITNVNAESGGKTRANIQKYGYRILPATDPTLPSGG